MSAANSMPARTTSQTSVLDLCDDFKFTFLASPKPDDERYTPPLSPESPASKPSPTNFKFELTSLQDSPPPRLVSRPQLGSALDMPSSRRRADRRSDYESKHRGYVDEILKLEAELHKDKSSVTFLSLPRELRDIVYELATTHFKARIGKKHGMLEPYQSRMRSLNSGLLLTSKQIRTEVLEPYLRNTLFTCRTVPTALAWIRKIPRAERKSLRHVRLEVASESEMASRNISGERWTEWHWAVYHNQLSINAWYSANSGCTVHWRSGMENFEFTLQAFTVEGKIVVGPLGHELPQTKVVMKWVTGKEEIKAANRALFESL